MKHFQEFKGEPNSVLDTTLSTPSPLTSSSTLSSSHGGAAVSSAQNNNNNVTVTNKNHASAEEKCVPSSLGMEDWDSVLSSSSPGQEQSILKLFMGDIDDPSLGLNRILHPTASHQVSDFTNTGFGVLDPGFGFESVSLSSPGFSVDDVNNNSIPGSVLRTDHPLFHQSPAGSNQQKSQDLNPASFVPSPYSEYQDHHQYPSPPKRFNPGQIGFEPQFHNHQKVLFSDSGQDPRTGNDSQFSNNHHQQIQQSIIDQIFKVSELIETGNPVLARVILARLNQNHHHQYNYQLSLTGNPFQRAAFYFKEALQFLLSSNSPPETPPSYNLIFKIGAYKSFSEISPILQFANFTCNQAMLESFNGFDQIHIIDFDIGYGGQWASLMQELVLRNGNSPSLKITGFASPLTHSELELGFTCENLKNFAREIKIDFEIGISNLEFINSFTPSENEAIAVNLPISAFSHYPSSLSSVLEFLKQISPKLVVSIDKSCDRTDVPFSHHMIHALQSYNSLLESLESVNMNTDSIEKIERFFIQPGIEKTVMNRHRWMDPTPYWRNVFLQCGFLELGFSNFTESQGECLVQRTPVRGFHVEKRQSSLVLCWQRKDLISISAWR